MENISGLPEQNTAAHGISPELQLDVAKYSGEVSDLGIPEEQLRELLETMWSIMRLFVEFGYSYDVSGRALMEIFRHAARGNEGDGK